MERFEYKPIDLQGRSFRLVQLFKAEYGVVRCELFDAWLDDDEGIIEYEALSYTWGGSDKPHEIELNDKILPVTKNLSLALRNLRYPHQDRILWIDAICIDQSNDKERGHQVLQMASIYKRAEQVVIWLGPATMETDLVLQTMSRFDKEAVKHACKDWKASDKQWLDIWHSVQPPGSDGQTVLASQQEEGLTDLLTRSWFDRVWIIQEVANARAAKVTCGTKSVSVRIFALLPFLAGVELRRHCRAILDIMPGPTRKYSWWTESQDLYTVLLKFRESEASDSRDKIYALLGISSDGSRAGFPVPDYEKSVIEVIRDTVAFLLHFDDAMIKTRCSPDWTMAEFLQNLEHLGDMVCIWAAEEGHEAIVKLLLDTNRAHVNFKNKYGQTSLLLAAKNGHDAIVKILLNTGRVEINLRNSFGQTPLLIAAENGHKTVVRQLLHTGAADHELADQFEWIPLWVAAINGHTDIIKMLLEIKETDKSTPTRKAALKMDKSLARSLLQVYKVEGHSGGSRRSHSPLWWAAQNGHMTLLELFLETGRVNIDSRNDYDEKLLPWLAFNGHQSQCESLLKATKVNFRLEDSWIRRLLSWAALKGKVSLVKVLLDTGRADVFFAGKEGEVLISGAASRGQTAVVSLLLDSGKSNDFGRGSALWQAANFGQEETLRLLIKRGKADVNFMLRDGQTPIWRAAWGGHTAAIKVLLGTPDIEVDKKDGVFLQTPLSIAAEYGHYSTVRLLLETGSVDVHSRERDGKTPLDLARGKSVVKLLRTYIESR